MPSVGSCRVKAEGPALSTLISGISRMGLRSALQKQAHIVGMPLGSHFFLLRCFVNAVLY